MKTPQSCTKILNADDIKIYTIGMRAIHVNIPQKWPLFSTKLIFKNLKPI